MPHWRQAGEGSHSWKGAITAPERHHLPNSKYSGWLTSTGRVAARDQLPRRDTRYRCTGCTPRKLSSSDGRGDTLEPSIVGESAHQAPGLLSCSDLGREQNAGPAESAPCGVPKYLNLSDLDLGSAYNPGPASDRSQQRNLEPKQCRKGKHTHREWGQTQCA